MTAISGKKWYVVMTQARSEALAAEHLDRQGFETYLPRILKLRRHARKTETLSSPLFPRYLFVAFDQASQRWQSIRSTRGVTQLLGAGDDPVRVPDTVIAELRKREDLKGFIAVPQKAPLATGDRVQIMGGAFSSCSAIFDFMSDNDRVAVLLNLLGRRVRMFVDRMAVAAA